MWLQTVVMADKIHDNCILPDLHNDLTEEQLVLQQNVFREK